MVIGTTASWDLDRDLIHSQVLSTCVCGMVTVVSSKSRLSDIGREYREGDILMFKFSLDAMLAFGSRLSVHWPGWILGGGLPAVCSRSVRSEA